MQLSNYKIRVDVNNVNDYQKINAIEHQNDTGVRNVEVEYYSNGNPLTFADTATATAAVVTDGVLINEALQCSFNADRTAVIVPIDNSSITTQSGIAKIEIKITEGEQSLTPPYAFSVRIKKPIVDTAQITPETLGTTAAILKYVLTSLPLKADAEKVYKIIYDRSFSDITSTLTTKNAFYRYSDGKKIENQDTTSALIAVENTSEYYVTGKTAGSTALAVFFDESKNYISAYKYGTVATYTDELVVLPNNCKYVAFCSYKGVELAVKTTEYKSAFDKFEPLKGKSVYVDGDSIMYGYGSDGYAVGEMLRDNDGMSLTKAAVSGTTLAVQAGKTNSICERMTAITNDYDYIIFDGGINDLSNHNSGGDNAIQFGEMTQSYTSDFDTSTTLGALESICSHLVNNYPKSKKMFVCIHNVVTPSKNINTGQIALFDEIKKVLEKWGIPYVDINARTNLKALSDTIRDTYFYKGSGTVGDRVHPTLEAYKMFYYPVIKSALLEV